MNVMINRWNRVADPEISVVVPIYNEQEVLPVFLPRLITVMDALDLIYELIFVDDGSKDASVDFLLEASLSHPAIRIARLSRNFGKEAALTAGIDLVRGAAAIFIDADLQDPPEEIPRMIAAWREDFDVVCMQRTDRPGESLLKKSSAHLFYRILNRISRFDIPEDTGDFRLMSRRALDALAKLPERQRYMKGLFAWVGFPTKVLKYARAPRAAGDTKWNYLALTGLALEGITSFSVAPLRWVTGLGLLAALAGMTFGTIIVMKTLFLGEPVHGYPSLMAVLTFLGGVQLLGIGLLGEYVGKTYFETKQRPVYLIRDVIESAPGNIVQVPSRTQEPRTQESPRHVASL